MAKDNDNPPFSEDSATELTKNVLKGKARKFVLIVKGGSVQTFVVFKKGAFGSKITAAKKAGFSGEATCGVIREPPNTLSNLSPARAARCAKIRSAS